MTQYNVDKREKMAWKGREEHRRFEGLLLLLINSFISQIKIKTKVKIAPISSPKHRCQEI